MAIICFALILSCISLSSSYHLSPTDYFKINSTYAKGVMNVGMTFRIDNLKEVKLEGLIGKELNGGVGKVVQDEDGTLLDFGGAFNEQRSWCNIHYLRQIGFLFKHQLPGISLPSFLPLNLTLVYDEVITFQLLLPISTSFLAAFPISSMSQCYESALISYVYGFGVEDLLIFSQDGRWETHYDYDSGFWNDEGKISYYRYQRQTLRIKHRRFQYQCILTPQIHKNTVKIGKNPITLSQLLRYDIPKEEQCNSDL